MNDEAPTGPIETEEPVPADEPVKRPLLARLCRQFALPIVLFWVVLGVVVNVFVPSIEENTKANAKALVPRDSPSSQAALVQGNAFRESDYTSAVVVLLETDGRKLDDQDHKFYNELVRRLREDKQHVQSLLDLWGKPVTKSGQQSADAEAATLTVRPTGDTGDATSSRSIDAIRDIVAKVPKPHGLRTYVTGPAALNTDTLDAADASMFTLTIVSVIVIIIMLLLAYRSVARALIPLVGVLLILATARGVVSFLVGLHVLGISSFAMNMLVALVLGVATDYGIFFIGRYNEARRAGHDKESAYYESVANTQHVILGSGMAISGSTLCLSLTKLNYFRTLGPPCFVGMVVAVVAALTLGPAMLALGGRIKWLQQISPTSPMWRRLGTAITRWPAAFIFVALLVVPLCVMNLATYKVSYNDRDFAPATVESVEGYAASDRHFPKSQLSVDNLYVSADHDMRNTTDLISLDRIAKTILRVAGISMVQGITRPNGRPLEHASLPYSMGSMGTKIGENLAFFKDRVADIDTTADHMGKLIEETTQLEQLTGRLEDLTSQLTGGTHLSREATDRMRAITDEVRDNLANVDDFFRPLRSYLYWERHCYDIPICWAIRSLNETVDNVDQVSEQLGNLVKGLAIIDTVTPQMVPQMHAMAEHMGTMVKEMRAMQSLTLSTQSTLHAMIPQMEVMIHPMIDMAQAFDNAKNDDFFFLPPESLQTENFKVGLEFFMTPDGKGARFSIFHEGEAMSPAGIQQTRNATAAAHEAIKQTALSNAKLDMAGASPTYRDVEDFSHNDLILMMLATFGLVFVIVLVITRALVGSILVLVVVVLSFAGSLGLASLIWETLLGTQLHWLNVPIAFIVLVGVGCDYNLLLLSRYREELDAGIATGMIRAIAGSLSVAVTAALVLAGTMLALLSSDVKNIGQAGSTIAIGLIFDMFIMRLCLVMPIARILGPWFWWPQRVLSRPRAAAGVRSAAVPPL
ncbi:RND family transporter [Mycobacterium sp. UM_CSW]|uniref:MMPL/RND family transporter n=1 Tax=Mycobacterium sp. UM_CSW TaxID=1370119 RepID=UPI00040C4F21|nr:RND family transporter [Mycobacterium sp. UM_CSW]